MKKSSSNVGSTEHDINNLVDSPSVLKDLGIIDEDKQGASPDVRRYTKQKSGHHGLKRLTTDEWND